MNIEAPVKDGFPVSFALGEDYPELRDAVRKIVAQALPGEALYGQTAKAGLPKGFAYAEARRAA